MGRRVGAWRVGLVGGGVVEAEEGEEEIGEGAEEGEESESVEEELREEEFCVGYWETHFWR